MTKCLAGFLLVAAAGCPSVKAVETTVPPYDGPTVEFDPVHKILPSPNNLGLDPTTGKVNLGAACHEGTAQAALRTGVLNQLDGFGTFEAAMQFTTNATATTDAAVDANSIAANVVMFQRTRGSTMIDPTTAVPIPLKVVGTGPMTRFASDCSNTQTANQVTIVPAVPLEQQSTYVVAVLDGLSTTGGQQFLPAPTWALVRQATEPVTIDANGNVASEHTPLDLSGCPQPLPNCSMAFTVFSTCPNLAQLCGIDQLWQAHAQGLAFLDKTGKVSDRSHINVAWEVTTQTTTDPLDPTVAGTPANTLGSQPLVAVASVTGGTCNAGTGCTAFFTANGLPCGAGGLPCASVGDVLGAGLGTIPYQVPKMNMFNTATPIPGQWSDPLKPMAQAGAILQVVAVLPNAPTPAKGWPTVVFGHAFGSKKETVLAIAPQLAKAGFATIAIDFQAHGSRAVQISSDAAIGCSGTPDPTIQHQCFAPFVSTDLGTTRDNIRQTVLDLQRLVRAAKACGTSSCGTLAIDPNHIVYAGLSLGGVVGSTAFAVDPNVNTAVLNTSGVGWVDMVENTATLELVCPLVDALIDANILMGAKWNGMDAPNATGLCTTPAWQMQPNYAQFRQAAQWILDPADGANFAAKLAPRRFLLMEVVNDQVVPNFASDVQGALLSLTPAMADQENTGTDPASVALTGNVGGTHWVRYANIPGAGAFPGNTFDHSSLLQPANPNPDGALGTARVQTDAIFYLVSNH